MSFIRPVDRKTRMRRNGEEAISSRRLTENEIAQIDAINNTSSYCRTLFFSYLALGTTLFILVSSTTHEDLLRETPVKMPLFDIGVPLLTFYFIAPLLFLLFHLNLLNKFWQLRSQIAVVDGANKTLVRSRLFPFDYALIDGGFEKSRQEQVVLWTIIGSTLYAMPVILFAYLQYKFLPYHSELITLWHRFLILGCIGGLIIFNRTRVVRHRAELHSWALFFSAIVLGASWLLFVVPGAWLDQPVARTFWEKGAIHVGGYRNLQLEGRTFWALDPPPANVAAYETANGFSDDVLIQARVRYGRPMSLDGRDLRYANLERTQFIEAQLNGAQLQGAVLKDAELQGAHLLNAKLQGAQLSGARLRGATMRRAQLQGAYLSQTELQGADLREAQLQGADMTGVRLQGAFLYRAQLQGAYLALARLEGTFLAYAQLQGASFFGAHLQGANLQGAELQHAYFAGAEFQGALLSGSTIQGTDFTHSNLYLTDFSDVKIATTSDEVYNEFWNDIPSIAASVPDGDLKQEMLRRFRQAAGRRIGPNFGSLEDINERAEGSLAGANEAFDNWPETNRDEFVQSLARFLADLACSGKYTADGIVEHRVDSSAFGTILARRLLTQECDDGDKLKDKWSPATVSFLNWRIKENEAHLGPVATPGEGHSARTRLKPPPQ